MGRKPTKKAKGLYFEKLEQNISKAKKTQDIQTLKDDDLFEVDTVGQSQSNRNQKRLDSLAQLLLNDNSDPTFKPKTKQPKPFTVAPVKQQKPRKKRPTVDGKTPKRGKILSIRTPLLDLDGEEDIVVHPTTGELVNKWTGRPAVELTKRFSRFEKQNDEDESDSTESSSQSTKRQQHKNKPALVESVPAGILAHALRTGKLTDVTSDNNPLYDYDVWDSLPPSLAGKETSSRSQSTRKLLDANREYFEDETKKLMKNRRHRSVNKVVIKRTNVAPPGLSINPQVMDVDALINLVQHRRNLSQKKIEYVRKRLQGNIIIPKGKEVFRRTKLAMRKLYKPVVVGPTKLKKKTRTERNKERRKRVARYEHAIALREKRKLKQFDEIPKILEKIERHQDYVKNKLPLLKKERDEFKRNQPKLLSRNFYVAPLPSDVPTEKSLKLARGQLRRATMSRNLLGDFFTEYQARNMVQTSGKRGKKSKRTLATTKMRDVRLAETVYQKEIDVDAIVQRAEDRARQNPKQFAPTKNKRRATTADAAADRPTKRAQLAAKAKAKKQSKTAASSSSSSNIGSDAKEMVNDDYDDDYVSLDSISSHAFADSDIWSF